MANKDSRKEPLLTHPLLGVFQWQFSPLSRLLTEQVSQSSRQTFRRLHLQSRDQTAADIHQINNLLQSIHHEPQHSLHTDKTSIKSVLAVSICNPCTLLCTTALQQF